MYEINFLYVGSFTALNVETPFTTAFLGDSITLVCNISYSSSQDLIGANPTLVWSTELNSILSTQTTTQVGRYFVSELSMPTVNSSYCGTYICTANDMLVAQSAMKSAKVEVGE